MLNKISTLTFENFFCHYNIKILRRVKIPKQNIEWENCFYIVKFRENVQITHIGSIYKKVRKMFIYPLSQGKLLGKDNVGGNEALRVNLLSNTQTRLK